MTTAGDAPVYNTFRQTSTAPPSKPADDFFCFHWTKLTSTEDEDHVTFCDSFMHILLTRPLNLLLLSFVPAMIFHYSSVSSGATFIFAILALAPLSERVVHLARQIDFHLVSTPMARGVVGIILGNIFEFVLGITMIHYRLRRLLLLYFLGNIFVHCLVSLGGVFLMASFVHVRDILVFDYQVAHVNGYLFLFLATCIAAPTVLDVADEASSLNLLGFSRFLAFLMLTVFGLFTYFQITTHASLFPSSSSLLRSLPSNSAAASVFTAIDSDDEIGDEEVEDRDSDERTSMLPQAPSSGISSQAPSSSLNSTFQQPRPRRRHPRLLPLFTAVLFLALFLTGTIFMSIALVGAFDDNANENLGSVSSAFLASIISPLVVHAAELYSVWHPCLRAMQRAHELRTQQQLYLDHQWRNRTMFREDEDSSTNNSNNDGGVASRASAAKETKPRTTMTTTDATSTNASSNDTRTVNAEAMVADVQPALAYCLQRSLHTWFWVVPWLVILSWMVGYDVTFVAGAFETSACCCVIVLQVAFWLLMASNSITGCSSSSSSGLKENRGNVWHKTSESTREYREVSGLLAACVFFVVFGNVAMGFWARSNEDLSA